MSIEEQDLVHLARCVALAEEALGQGHAPFGSILVDSEGHVLFEDRNRDTGLFGTRHPELAIAQWAEANIPRPLRGVLTVYTSGEHCPMCAAAHAWAGLGRIVFATSTLQLVDWLTGLGSAPGPVAPLRITDVVPDADVDGPAPELAEGVRALHTRHHERFREGGKATLNGLLPHPSLWSGP